MLRSEPAPAEARFAGERRQVTVLFCDLVGSTDFASRLDPEELCNLMRCFQDTCARAIKQFDGYIAQTLGDGLLVYFGFPEAHEDDASRAVRAGLAAVSAVSDETGQLFRSWGRCAIRVGIHTGLVFAGPVGEFDTRTDRALVGETPNLAARLQSIAGPNEVLVGPRTRSLIADSFKLKSLGPRAIKGLPEPVEVFRVTERRRTLTRFRGQETSQRVAMVGRDDELATLKDAWQRAVDGRGQTVLISGEAGIGKSRLVDAFCTDQCSQTFKLVYQCLPYFQHTALYPVLAQVRNAAGLRRRDSTDLKLTKLRRLFNLPRDDQSLALGRWARLLQISTRIAPELDDVSPSRLLDDTIDFLAQQVIALSHVQPVLVLVEDAHWIDTVSRRLVATLSERILSARVMIAITDRSGFAELSRLERVVKVPLQVLQPAELHSMISQLASGSRLPRRVMETIGFRSEGIPFYVEELTKSVLEAGEQAQLVPVSLKDMLTARLDRLGPHKLVAQRGACIGSAFSYEMIRFVSGLDPSSLELSLQALVNADILACSGEPPAARFMFRHSLLNDAVYESMLLQERRAVHLAIAHKLEEEAPEICQQEPELLGRHFGAAGDARTAARYWLQAGEIAQGRSAHLDAIAYLRQGLAALSTLTRTPEDDITEIQLQFTLSRSYMAGEGWAGPNVHAAYTRALALAREHHAVDTECELLWGLCAHLSVSGDFAKATALADVYVQLAEGSNDSCALLMADSAAVLARACRGDFMQARFHANRIHARYSSSRCDQLVQTYNHDPLVLASIHESIWLWVQGRPDSAVEASQRAIRRARELSHTFNLCYALANGCCVHVLRRDSVRALRLVDEALALADYARIRTFRVYAPLMGAPALMAREPTNETLEWLERCLALMREARVGMHMPMYLGHIAAAYNEVGALAQAETHMMEASRMMERTGELWIEPELLRIRAAISRRMEPKSDAAELRLWTALERARCANARGFELRILCDLAELLHAQGRVSEIEELLNSLYQTFTEGFSSADMVSARAWLERCRT